MRKKVYSVLLCTALTILSGLQVLHAQKPAQYVKLGDEALDAGRFAEAEGFYRQAFALDSTSFEVTQKYAETARMIKDYALASRLYEKTWNKDEGKIYPEGLFWWAMMEKYMARYEEAESHFRKYLKKNKKKGNYFHDKAKQEAEACAWVFGYKMLSDSLISELVPAALHSPESENAAIIHSDQFFFSRYKNQPDSSGWSIWKGYFVEGVVTNIRAVSETSLPEANLCFGRNNEVFFTRCSQTSECAVWTGTWEDEKIVGARKLNAIFDAESTTTMPHYVTIQGIEHLFFASDREKGEGKMDIWFSRKKGDEWDEPVNAGKRINTRDDELSPFYSNGTLYFSSDWHYGFGGQDVFRISGSPGMWGEPENMGQPVNTAQNDLFFSVFPSEKRCFVSSNRLGGEAGDEYSTCCNDIYAWSFGSEEPEELAYQSLEELNRFLPVRLYFHNDEPNPRSRDSTTNLSYSETYDSYMKWIDGYLRENKKGLSGSKSDDAELEVEGFFHLKVEQGMKDLEMFNQLLLKELQQGKHVELSIRGFASPRAKSDYNEILTKRRIQSLVLEMSHWNKEALVPFMNNDSTVTGRLTFRSLPFGENQSASGVSDDLTDEKASIYSLGARLERKIEIESVQWLPAPEVRIVKLDEPFFDFGKIRQRDGIVYHNFELRNGGSLPIQIDSLTASCGCTEPRIDKTLIEQGSSATINVGFNPFGKKGLEVKQVIVYIHGEEPRVIEIAATVE